MAKLDEKDGIILNLLQKDCRTSLTDIAKKVNLSIDSVKKRLNKMKGTIFHPRIQIRPRSLGFPNIIDIKIKLNNHIKEDIDQFISYLAKHERVSELFKITGNWDISIVVISKDAQDLEEVTATIKSTFGHMIDSWIESTSLEVFKFEEYDMVKLIQTINQGVQ